MCTTTAPSATRYYYLYDNGSHYTVLEKSMSDNGYIEHEFNDFGQVQEFIDDEIMDHDCFCKLVIEG